MENKVSAIVNDLFFYISSKEKENPKAKLLILCISKRVIINSHLSSFFLGELFFMFISIALYKTEIILLQHWKYVFLNKFVCIQLLPFLLLSVFQHKIYVLNVIARTKSNVNFISFVCRCCFVAFNHFLFLFLFLCFLLNNSHFYHLIKIKKVNSSTLHCKIQHREQIRRTRRKMMFNPRFNDFSVYLFAFHFTLSMNKLRILSQ